MPKLSRLLPSPYTTIQVAQQLYDAIMLLESEDEVYEFFTTLLTSVEIKMLAKRLAISQMYLTGLSYREISDELKVSDNTIARISSRLSDSQTVVKVLKELKQIEKSRIQTKRMHTLPEDKYL